VSKSKSVPETKYNEEPKPKAQLLLAEPKLKVEPESKPEPQPKDNKNRQTWNKHLSFGQFLVSQFIIILLAVMFIGGMYLILNPLKPTIDPFKSPVTQAPVSLYLDINNPENESVSFDQSIILSGKTTPKASIIISSADYDLGVDANEFGDFSTVFPLAVGPNQIHIQVFDSMGNTKSVVRSVYYSQEKL
jgi:hypothetical protein